MKIKATFRLFITILTVNISIAQNPRDITIHDSIYPMLFQNEQYQKVKSLILNLEKQYGSEPEFKYYILGQSFNNNDLIFFKETLSDLVKNYGVNYNYFTGEESYFKSISEGELSKWFQEMYLKNHFIWMKNNFSKQRDLNILNSIKYYDNLVVNFNTKVEQSLDLDSIQKIGSQKALSEFYFENLSNLYQIMRKYDVYPTGKSFAVIQNNFGVVEMHNEKSEYNFERMWLLFYPYYKKAYLNNEVDYIIFKNHDLWSFVHNQNQDFGLLEVEKLPKMFNPKNVDSVPIRDLEFYEEIKKEFNWD